MVSGEGDQGGKGDKGTITRPLRNDVQHLLCLKYRNEMSAQLRGKGIHRNCVNVCSFECTAIAKGMTNFSLFFVLKYFFECGGWESL